MVKEDFPIRDQGQKPTEEEIEALLSVLRPQPGKRFYQLMANAPWQERPMRFKPWVLRSLAVTALVVIIALAAAVTIPSVGATARQLLHFFLPSTSDQETLTAPFPLPGSQMETYYSLNLEQAQKEAGFTLKTITLPPENMVFSGAHVDPLLKAAALRYTDGQDNLIFTQRPLGKVEEYSSIGASATVEPVQVRGLQGEFVSGAWRQKANQVSIKETSLPGTQTDLGLYWDAGFPQHILRWQENGMAFEMIYTGDKIGKANMIEIANSIR
jgi:hypothetical protein